MLKRIAYAVLASSCTAAIVTAAHAQDAVNLDSESPETESAAETQTIVVTANRREESALDVPISLTAMSQESLDKQGVRDIGDLSRISPGVNFSQGPRGTTNIAIRGISSTEGSSTTGVYLDDTPIQVRDLGAGGFSTNAYPAIFDVERVEVLRGPQGTLFGAGSQGGTVRFIAPEPGLTDYSTYVRSELAFTEGGAPSYELGAAVGGPIVEDRIGFRVSGFARRDGGWIDHGDPLTGNIIGKDVNDISTVVARAALKFALTDNLTISPSVYYQSVKRKSEPNYWRNLSSPENGKFVTGSYILGSGEDEYILGALDIDYDLGPVVLSSNTSLFDRKNANTVDYTHYMSELLRLDYRTGHVYEAPNYNNFDGPQKTFTQEVRLQSDGSGPLSWVIGGFYQVNRQEANQEIVSPNLNAMTQGVYGGSVEEVFGIPLLPGDIFYYGYDKSRDKQIAGFGQLDYEVLRGLTFTLGARYAKTKFRSANSQGGAYNGGETSATTSQSESPFTPKFGVNYKPNEDLMLYATVAKGFRTGGGNNPVPVTQCGDQLAQLGYSSPPVSYDSDTVWSYEAGTKGSVGRFLTFEASGFYIKWSDIQSNVSLSGCGFSFTGNLGTAESKGFDAHLSVRPLQGLVLDGSVAYTDAEFVKDILTEDVNTGAQSILINKGDPLLVAPWTVNVSADYSIPIDSISLGADAYTRLDYSYTSSYQFGREDTPGFDPLDRYQAATHIANLRAGVRLGNLDVSAFVDNLFDSYDWLSSGRGTRSTLLFREVAFRPRTVGITVSYRD